MATILQRESGRWQVRIRRAGGKVASRTFDTKTAAEQWARREESQIDRGEWRDQTLAHRTFLAQLLQEYESEIAGKRRSAVVTKFHLARFREDLGHHRLEQLTPAVLAKWRDDRLKYVQPATVSRELATLGGALTWARKEKMIPIPENPVSGIRRPDPGRARERRLLSGEPEALLAALTSGPEIRAGASRSGKYQTGTRNPWLAPLVLLAVETAMRQGELLSLRWSDVDLDSQVAKLDTTKNGDVRWVPLSSRAVAILAELAKESSAPDARVFTCTAEAVKLGWRRAVTRARERYVRQCKGSGVPPDPSFLVDLRFHDLRHEAASRLAEKLPNLIELAAVTGHRDLRMLKRYYHPRASDLAKKLG